MQNYCCTFKTYLRIDAGYVEHIDRSQAGTLLQISDQSDWLKEINFQKTKCKISFAMYCSMFQKKNLDEICEILSSLNLG